MAMNVVDGVVLDAALTATADAIRAKGVSGSFPFDMTTQTGFASAVASIPSGGGGGEVDSGVIFLDYDGTIVESWGSADVASKTALPDNPAHTGLIGQGWNWDLQHIKDYISAYENANVCVEQMYKTVSGLTEIDITVTKVTGLTVDCKMVGNKNWGDGTTNRSTSHTYEDYGDYTITCDGTSIPNGTSSTGGLFATKSSNVNRFWCTAIRIGEDVTSIGSYAFKYCYSLTSVTIPSSVTSFGSDVFYYCYSLKSVTIPSSVTSIGSYAFTACYSLTSVTFPSSVTRIGSNMFSSCNSLTRVTIPSSVTSINDNAFSSCSSLTSVTIPSSVTSIGSYVFNQCYSLTSVTIPQGVTSIGDNTFQSCSSLTSVTIPSSVTSIGKYAFQSCSSLTSVTIPQGVTSIGDHAFGSCSSLTSVTIPSSVTSIDSAAFLACRSLKSVTIPSSVTNIDNSVFTQCYSLTSVIIPQGVTSIGASAFSPCYAITKYDFTSATAVPTLSNVNAFTDINGICKIIVPDALYDTWIAATNWSTYANYIYKASEVID